MTNDEGSIKLAPFERTVCDCAECVECCRRPGHLIPADLFRIADRLLADGRIQNQQEVFTFLRASRGAVVGDSVSGKLFRIGTITPKTQDGQCVFLHEGRCTIHSVAPFGCAFFDAHMDQREGDIRSMWGLKVITSVPAYDQARQMLIAAEGVHEPFQATRDMGQDRPADPKPQHPGLPQAPREGDDAGEEVRG